MVDKQNELIINLGTATITHQTVHKRTHIKTEYNQINFCMSTVLRYTLHSTVTKLAHCNFTLSEQLPD